MESFEELGLPAFLGEALKRMNFIKPTPVQAQAIPAGLAGKDVIASAQTGTGKTGAFGIPLLNYLSANQGKTAMVLTPTRELAMQVQDVLRKLTGTHYMGGSVLLIGGANMGTQLAALARKPRLFIGTPGRVIDHLQRGSLDLSQAGFLVLDEADRMLDMGFAPQLEEIRKRLPATRQTLLFSATFPPDIQQMGSRYLTDPVRITVGETSKPISKISQKVLYTPEAGKSDALAAELTERRGSILVFARTQSRVDRITERLKEKGFKATRIHGGRSQSQRRQAIDQFRDGKFDILVATDIAARGLDIHHIAHVINYDLPRNPEDYIHRVGRTARAGAEGSSLCFLTPEDRSLWNSITRLIGAPKDSIEVKPSQAGDRGPKHPGPAPSSKGPHRGRPSGPPHRSHSRPSQDRDRTEPSFQRQAPPPPPPRSEGPSRPQVPSEPQGDDRGNRVHQAQGGPPRGFDRNGGRPGGSEGFRPAFQKNRHPDGRHQRRSDRHWGRESQGGDDNRGNRTFHQAPSAGPNSQGQGGGQDHLDDDEKQPMDNSSVWGGKFREEKSPTGFIQDIKNRFTPQGRPGGFQKPFQHDGRPRHQHRNGPGGGFRRDFGGGRPGFGQGQGGSDRPFRSEFRPGGGNQRPHRQGPGGGHPARHGQGGGFHQDQRPGGHRPGGHRPGGNRPGGHFKKQGFRPRPH